MWDYVGMFFFWRYPVRCTTPISFRNGFLNGHSDVSIPNFHSHFHLEFFFRNAWHFYVFSHLFSPQKRHPGVPWLSPRHSRPRRWSCRRWRRCYTCGWVIWWSVRWKMRRRCFAWVGWWFYGWMVVGWWFWKVWLVKNLPQKWKLVKSESKSHWVCFIDSGDGSVFLQVVTFAQLGFMGTQRRQIQGGRGWCEGFFHVFPSRGGTMVLF